MSVVVPVCDGAATLVRCLQALTREDPYELLVVDDGSVDGSAAIARRSGALVLGSGGRRLGPARARNVGVERCTGEIVLFVDADVVAHPGTLVQVASAFQDPGLTAVFGSYDASPDHRGFASLYMNLRHHLYHQERHEPVSTFWAGLGAVRREAFRAVGGFDAATYARPSVEDIDLGVRLTEAGGRIRRDPGIRGTHLKRWSVPHVVRTDIFQRAVPWTRLMARHPGAFTDLNVSAAERGKAVLAAALLAVVVAAATGAVPLWSPLPVLVAAALANARLLRVFRRGGGVAFALGGLLFHQLYYLYGAVTYAVCRVAPHRERQSAP